MSQYPSNRSSRTSDGYARPASSTQPGISRSRQGAPRASGYDRRPSGQRPSGQRAASGQRGYSQRPAGQRQYSGGRAPQGGRRGHQRRKPQGRFFALLAVLLVVLVALIIIIVKPGGGRVDNPTPTVANVETQTPQATSVDADWDNTTVEEPKDQSQYANISQMLADSDNSVEGLSEADMVQVEGLSINQGLSDEWLNVLLLGTDERTLSDSARTDAIMICSINRKTGEVKLTSIMRDLNVTFTDIGKWNGDYRINAANYFGGPKLAMKTVNELFDKNIQNYVMVNFFGFGKIAQALGGIEVDLAQEEVDIINKDIREQYKMAYRAGITDFDNEQTYVEAGQNVHLNGNQALAYARIRHLDGGDYMRTTRQQTVLTKLLEKTKKLSPLEMAMLAQEMLPWIKTNMNIDDILVVANTVVGNGMSGVKTFRLPVTGTYKEGVRNEDSRLWDCDFQANAVQLYNFIYE